MKKAMIALVFAAASSAHAQGVTAMEFTIGATMLAPKGVVTSCGLEFNGVALKPGPEIEADTVAGSIAVHVDMDSLVKAGHQTAYRKGDGIGLRPMNDQVAWLRIEGGMPLTPLNDLVVKGEKPPFHLFGVPPRSAFLALAAMIQGKTIWIGFAENGTVRSIFSGQIKPDPTVTQQLNACLVELETALKQSQKPTPKPSK